MITKEKEELLKFYNLGLAAYKQRKWDEAIKSFEMALKIIPGDGPSELYLEPLRKLLPPMIGMEYM
jgi:adenylate cyclase